MDSDRSPLVSVLMPVRNAEATVEESIRSILVQDFRDWELVAVNDGSTDDTATVLDRLAREDGRVRLFHRDHHGIVGALQSAASKARGRYLARMDADDVARPERLRLQLFCFEGEPDLGLCGGRVRMVGETIGLGRRRYEAWVNSLVRHEDIVRELFVECPIPHPTFMMSREWHDRVGGYLDGPWPEDYELVFRLWRAGARFVKPEPVVLDWRDKPGRLSMNDHRYSGEAFRSLKRRFLGDYPTRAGRPMYQWGAGEVGKRWLREWGNDAPLAVVDINPRKLGRKIHGVTVVAPEDLPAPVNCFVVVMVGSPGARDEIRNWLEHRGHREGADYLFLA